MMAIITIGESVVFTCGFICVYLIARFCRILCWVLPFVLVLSAHAQSNDVVAQTEISQVDYTPAFVAGFGVGLSMLGFGWVLRLVYKIPGGGDGPEY